MDTAKTDSMKLRFSCIDEMAALTTRIRPRSLRTLPLTHKQFGEAVGANVEARKLFHVASNT